jgi:hypothetical protein
MINRFFILLSISLLWGQVLRAEVQINSYRKHYSWKPEWSNAIKEEILSEGKKDENILSMEIDEEDLDDLECDGYNKASLEEKTDFWIVFFSALTRAESGFNEKAMSPKTRGHRSFGLLQLAKQTAKSKCGITPPDSNVLNGEDNLKCGVKLMTWQLLGAPTNSGKKLRSDLEGQIFGKYIFQWGPLRQNDHRGRKLLVDWFKDHLDQLKFCSRS